VLCNALLQCRRLLFGSAVTAAAALAVAARASSVVVGLGADLAMLLNSTELLCHNTPLGNSSQVLCSVRCAFLS
jgi:sulfopyruvate decarboxylase TPP-binding subunit